MALIGVLVVFKAQYIFAKVNLVEQGIALYKEEHWIEAEEKLQLADTYRWFHYREEEAHQALASLEWITQYKDFIETLYGEICASKEALDFEQFMLKNNQYQTSGINELDDVKRQYLLAKYPVDQVIDEGFMAFFELMKSKLTNPLENEDYNWAKESIGKVPDVYFKEDKEKMILDLFMTCDTELYEFNKTVSGIGSFKNLLELLNDMFTTNRRCGYDSDWIMETAKMDIYQLLLEASKEEVSAFSEYIKAYRQKVHEGYKDPAVEALVDDFMLKKEEEIQELLRTRQYDELLKLYEELRYFKDYRQEIEVAKKLQKYNQLELLFEKPIEEYDYVREGENDFGASKYILGINKKTQVLEMHTLVGGYEDYKVVTYTYSLKEGEINLGQIQDIMLESNLILFITQGDDQVMGIKVFTTDNQKLEKVFEIQAKEIRVSNQLKQIAITDPIEEEMPGTYDYIYDGTSYVKQELVPIAMSLQAANLLDYKGKVVSFECYLPQQASGNAIEAYGFAGDTYYIEDMVYIYWEDGRQIPKGTYTVVGEFVDTQMYYNEATQTELAKPKIRIIELKKS